MHGLAHTVCQKPATAPLIYTSESSRDGCIARTGAPRWPWRTPVPGPVAMSSHDQTAPRGTAAAEGRDDGGVSTPQWPWRPPAPGPGAWHARSPPRLSGTPQTRASQAAPACRLLRIRFGCISQHDVETTEQVLLTVSAFLLSSYVCSMGCDVVGAPRTVLPPRLILPKARRCFLPVTPDLSDPHRGALTETQKVRLREGLSDPATEDDDPMVRPIHGDQVAARSHSLVSIRTPQANRPQSGVQGISVKAEGEGLASGRCGSAGGRPAQWLR